MGYGHARGFRYFTIERDPVYNFCVAVDDATMGITHVLRAEEHLPNTLRQALVCDALELRDRLSGTCR